ncbi:MAG TPA: hypothetical protein VKS60_09000 [Stellaceae bacterium]|nr:hypothetical protein [Stellaceae bacterium]
MTFDIAASLRRVKPQRSGLQLSPRNEADLPFVTASIGPGAELLLDTGIYIDILQARMPPEVKRLLASRTQNHSSVALAELTHLFGRLDPNHKGTAASLAALRLALDRIPQHRLTAPSLRACGEAGMLAGLAARLTGRAPGTELLNDALLFLQAGESGRTLLTSNIRDFDHLQQLAPWPQILFYRRS